MANWDKLSPIENILCSNRVIQRLLKESCLSWTELMIICQLAKLEGEGIFHTPADLVESLDMSKNWVYRALRKLRGKNLIYVYKRPKGSSFIGLAGAGALVLHRLGDYYQPAGY